MMRFVLLAVILLTVGTAGYVARCLNTGRKRRAVLAALACLAVLALGYLALGIFITSM